MLQNLFHVKKHAPDMLKQSEHPIDPNKPKKKPPTQSSTSIRVEIAAPSVAKLDEDLDAMKEMKYNQELEHMARRWIENVLQTQFPSPSFVESLKSGVILCK